MLIARVPALILLLPALVLPLPLGPLQLLVPPVGRDWDAHRLSLSRHRLQNTLRAPLLDLCRWGCLALIRWLGAALSAALCLPGGPFRPRPRLCCQLFWRPLPSCTATSANILCCAIGMRARCCLPAGCCPARALQGSPVCPWGGCTAAAPGCIGVQASAGVRRIHCC